MREFFCDMWTYYSPYQCLAIKADEMSRDV